MLISIFLSISLDNSIFRLMPFIFLHSLRVINLVSILINIKSFKSIEWKSLFNKTLLALFFYGVSLSLIRYFILYQDDGYSYLPILRHSISFILGWSLFLSFKYLAEKYTLLDISRSLVISASVPLVYGLYEKLSGHKVGTIFYRIDSFFSEPSYYGDYLVLLVAPCLLNVASNFKRLEINWKIFYILLVTLFFINLFSLQSGTALMKFGSLLCCFFFLYPVPIRVKLGLVALGMMPMLYLTFIDKGYINAIWNYVIVLRQNPGLFFTWEYYTIYDRFFSIYTATANIISINGLVGLGFGGDYYEFKNLFPPSTHADLLRIKPSLSFFTSLTARLFVYFGIFGVILQIWLYLKCLKTKNIVIRIGFLNLLVTCLWGLANFSLPYLWFWLALSLHSQKLKREIN